MQGTELLSRLDTVVSELDLVSVGRAPAPELAPQAGRLGEAIDQWAEAAEADEDTHIPACALCGRLESPGPRQRLPEVARRIAGALRDTAERRWCACPTCGTWYEYHHAGPGRPEGAPAETLTRASAVATMTAVQLRHWSRSASPGLVAPLLANLRALRVLFSGAAPGAAARRLGAGVRGRASNNRQA